MGWEDRRGAKGGQLLTTFCLPLLLPLKSPQGPSTWPRCPETLEMLFYSKLNTGAGRRQSQMKGSFRLPQPPCHWHIQA